VCGGVGDAADEEELLRCVVLDDEGERTIERDGDLEWFGHPLDDRSRGR
jgi:hypothetical protein